MYANQCLDDEKKEDAFKALSRTYDLMASHSANLSDLEKVRVIALSTKLAELCEEEGKVDKAEKWYGKAVESTLKWFKVPLTPENSSIKFRGLGAHGQEETVIFPTMIPTITSWLFDHSEKQHLKPDPTAPFVNLARLYSKQGRVELSSPTRT